MITYAKAATKLAKTLDKFESRAKDGDWIDKQTSERVNQKIKAAMERLSIEQIEDSGSPEMMEKGGWIPGAMQAGSMMFDWLGAKKAGNQMKGPAAPVFQSAVSMNKNVNIGGQLAQIKNQQAGMNRQANQFSSQSSRFAGKALASSQATQASGQAHAGKIAAETELTNRERLYNHYVNSQNNQIANNYNQGVVDFLNQKTAFQNNNNQMFSAKLQQLGSDLKAEAMDKKKIKSLQELEEKKMTLDKQNFELMLKMFGGVGERLAAESSAYGTPDEGGDGKSPTKHITYTPPENFEENKKMKELISLLFSTNLP
jgi:hypothetical protein